MLPALVTQWLFVHYSNVKVFDLKERAAVAVIGGLVRWAGHSTNGLVSTTATAAAILTAGIVVYLAVVRAQH